MRQRILFAIAYLKWLICPNIAQRQAEAALDRALEAQAFLDEVRDPFRPRSKLAGQGWLLGVQPQPASFATIASTAARPP